MRAAVRAFRTGKTSDGATFSGEYGDLGAMLVEILTDREQHSEAAALHPTAGKLREPLLKVMNIIRSMGYAPRASPGRELMLRNIAVIGQDPMNPPSVFSYFLAEFSPFGPLSRRLLTAPEAEVLTSPRLVAFWNGVRSLIRHGLTNCKKGFGHDFVRDFTKTGVRRRICDEGKIAGDADWVSTFQRNKMTTSELVSHLSLLLTGGRLSKRVREAIESLDKTGQSADGPKLTLEKALQMFAVAPEFHTLNTAAAASDRTRPKLKFAGKTTGKPFKTLIILRLAGGADSFHMVMPHSGCGAKKDSYLYDEYKAVRGETAAKKEDLLQFSPNSARHPCSKFGLHKNLKTLHDMYNKREASLFANMGNLIEPLSKADLNAKPRLKRVPRAVHSHADGTSHASTLDPEVANAAGVLGKIQKALNKRQASPATKFFSYVGTQKIANGGDEAPLVLSQDGVVAEMSGIEASVKSNLTEKVGEISSVEYSSAFAEHYLQEFVSTRESTSFLGSVIKDVKTKTTFRNSGLSKQFREASKLVQVREKLGAERLVIVTSIGGFDTHNTFTGYPNLLTNIDNALEDLQKELKALNVWNSTLIVSYSEFARTLSGNGKGSDHG
jgi:cullin-associated NEDD8-dissociated protein 1